MSIRKLIGGNGPIPDIVPYSPESVEVAEYLLRLGPRERIGHELAQRRLQTCYEPVKTNGFLAWREQCQVPTAKTRAEVAEDAYYAHMAARAMSGDTTHDEEATALLLAVQRVVWEDRLCKSEETRAAKAAGKKWAAVRDKQVQGYYVTKKAADNAATGNLRQQTYMAKLDVQQAGNQK
jgi:hypothetical protein